MFPHMLISHANRSLVITFISIFMFVVLILVATMIPGLNGVQLAAGVALPLDNPVVIVGCLIVGAVTGRLRSTLLFVLPASFAIGLVGGMMVHAQLAFSVPLMLSLLVTLLLWATSLWLLKGVRDAGICLFFVGVAAILGIGQPMPVEVYGHMMFTLLGMLLSALLLIASGVCVLVALNDVDSLFPELDRFGLPVFNISGIKCWLSSLTGRNLRISL